MSATTWPFDTDADRDDPLTQMRIAVTSCNPSWAYLVAFDRDSEVRPTDPEAAMLASFLDEYKTHWYGTTGGYLKKLGERPLDVDGGANGVLFHKYADNDWAHRRRTWIYGPWFVPQHPRLGERGLGPLTLERLLDHIHSFAGDGPSKRWVEWKAQHPEVFPPATTEAGQ